MEVIQDITKPVLRYPGQPPQEVPFVCVGEVFQAGKGLDQRILYDIHRIDLWSELSVDPKPDDSSYPFTVHPTESIDRRPISLLG